VKRLSWRKRPASVPVTLHYAVTLAYQEKCTQSCVLCRFPLWPVYAHSSHLCIDLDGIEVQSQALDRLRSVLCEPFCLLRLHGGS
jgi:hypothetical protein